MITRRGLLKGMVGAGLAVPFIASYKMQLARGAAGLPKFLFVYIPNGAGSEGGRSLWHPSGAETVFTLPQMTEPLGAVKGDCIFIQGLDMFGGERVSHTTGMGKVLTGADLAEVHATSGATISLDVFLGQKFQARASTPHTSLQIGAGAGSYNPGSNYVSFAGPNQIIVPDDSPASVFKRVFGGATMPPPVGGEDPSAAAARLRAQKQQRSVLDVQMAEIGSLRARLGNVDRAKLDTHTESLREIERRLRAATGEPGTPTTPATACSLGTMARDVMPYTSGESYRNNASTTKAIRALQTDLAVMALACGQTRSASLMWLPTITDDLRPSEFLGDAPTGPHNASHYENGTLAGFTNVKRTLTRELAALIQKLKQTPDPSGGMLLDNTVVYVGSELGDGSAHNHRNVPFLVAGGQALGVRTGRYLNVTGTNGGDNQPHAKLLRSIAKACGVTDPFGGQGGTSLLDGF